MSAKLYDFTPKMIAELKLLYPNTHSRELAVHFNCSYRKICNLAFQLKLKKNIEWIRETARKNMLDPNHPGRQSCFKKGIIPANKGKKQTEYMTPEAIEKTKSTRFKKGHRVWNHKEIGFERITKDGYIELKVAEPNVFKLKHRVMWEKHNGPIPKGYNIQFHDGNKLNCCMENLYIISRSDQLKYKNSLIVRYPVDIQLAIRAKGALNRQINKILNQE